MRHDRYGPFAAYAALLNGLVSRNHRAGLFETVRGAALEGGSVVVNCIKPPPPKSRPPMTPPVKERFFRNTFFLRELCFTEKLWFASAPPEPQTPSSAWWRDAALERKSTSGASATGPVS